MDTMSYTITKRYSIPKGKYCYNCTQLSCDLIGEDERTKDVYCRLFGEYLKIQDNPSVMYNRRFYNRLFFKLEKCKQLNRDENNFIK